MGGLCRRAWRCTCRASVTLPQPSLPFRGRLFLVRNRGHRAVTNSSEATRSTAPPVLKVGNDVVGTALGSLSGGPPPTAFMTGTGRGHASLPPASAAAAHPRTRRKSAKHTAKMHVVFFLFFF